MPSKLDDASVASALTRAVWVIEPVLDLLATRDPIGLKGLTHKKQTGDSNVDNFLHAIAWAVDKTDFPGTASWSTMPEKERATWWVNRIGAINTVAVAFPGLLGAVANRLPIGDVLGFANQAMVLVAVAKEHGVRDRHDQVDLLASVLCQRTLDSRALAAAGKAVPAGEAKPADASRKSFSPFTLLTALWETAQTLRGVSGELNKRPQSRTAYRWLGSVPVVGAVAGYFGERGALSRAAKLANKWVTAHPDAVSRQAGHKTLTGDTSLRLQTK